MLHALCMGVLRNYKLIVRLLRLCGYRGPVRGGRAEWWLPLVAGYEAVFRREAVPPDRLYKFLDKKVVSCLRRIEPLDAVRGLGDGVERLSVLYSVPRWIVEKLLEALRGDYTRLESILRAFQEEQPIYIRFNKSMVNAREAIEILSKLGVEAEPDPVLDDVLVARRVSPGSIARLPGGLFYIQDRAALLVAHVLSDVKGVVLDSFSAPGGKAGHIAWRRREYITALELSRRRLMDEKRLLYRQKSLHIIDLVLGDARRPPVNSVAAAIVDPDCSSIGRIGRSPETRLFLEQSGPRIVERLSKLQYEGLRAAALVTRRGGVIVYSTCTLTLEENEGVVRRLVHEGLVELEDAAPWIGERSPVIPETQRVYPDRASCGGGFVARLVRV